MNSMVPTVQADMVHHSGKREWVPEGRGQTWLVSKAGARRDSQWSLGSSVDENKAQLWTLGWRKLGRSKVLHNLWPWWRTTGNGVGNGHWENRVSLYHIYPQMTQTHVSVFTFKCHFLCKRIWKFLLPHKREVNKETLFLPPLHPPLSI